MRYCPQTTTQYHPLWMLLVGLCMLVMVGCLAPDKLAENYASVSITQLPQETQQLKLSLYFCDHPETPPLVRQREILNPLGQEDFYLPPLQAGHLSVFIEAYHINTNTNTKELVGYLIKEIKAHPGGTVALDALPLTHGQLPEGFQFKACTSTPQSPKEDTLTPASLSGQYGSTGISTDSSQENDTAGDHLIARGHIFTGYPSHGITSLGHRVLLSNSASDYSTDSLMLADARSDKPTRFIELHDNCIPKSISLHGNTYAVICEGTERLLAFSLNTHTIIGPKDGWALNKGPQDLALSGPYAVVAHKQDKHLLVFNVLHPTENARSLPIASTPPTALATVNGEFFVGHHNAQSGQVSTFYFTSQGNIRIGQSYTSPTAPTALAVNGSYLLIANENDERMTIYDRTSRKPQAQQMYLHGVPKKIALLGHTALVITKKLPRLYVVNLQTRRVVQTLTLPVMAKDLHITGEWVLLSSDEKYLMRYQLTTRYGLMQLHVGTSLRSLSLQQQHAYTQDTLSKRTVALDLLTASEHIVPNVIQKPVVQHHDWGAAQWMTTTDQIFLRTNETGTALYFHNLQSGLQEGEALPFLLPVRAGHVQDGLAFLSHWEDGNDETPAFITRIQLSKKQQNEPWDAITMTLPFGRQKTEIVGILPWGVHTLLLDQYSQNLYLMEDQLKTSASNNAFVLKDALTLPGQPVRMVRVGEKVAIAYNITTGDKTTGYLKLLDVASFIQHGHAQASSQTIQLHGQVGALKVYKQFLLVTDRTNHQLHLLDPTQKRLIATFSVGCDPTEIAVWKRKDNEHIAVILNQKDAIMVPCHY